MMLDVSDSIQIGEQAAWREGMDDSRQCRLVLGDSQRGYERLRNEAKRGAYHAELTKAALTILYKDANPTATAPGAGTWIKTVRDAGKAGADRWIGVGIWTRVFKSFGLVLRENDIEWKPTNHSLVTCFDSLNKEEVSIRGLSVERTVRIVNTFITNWDFLRKSLTQALAKSAEIQILLLDYNSPQVAYRAWGLGITQAKMEAEIQNNLKLLREFYTERGIGQSAPSRFEVRLYDAAPVVSVYWFDNVAYFGLYWMGQSSIETPQLRIEKEKNSVIFASMEKHFDLLWANARCVLPEK